jgi:hypothetical protein
MKITKRVRVLAAVMGSGIVVASSACGVDSTSPTKAPVEATPEQVSRFVPTQASKALIGVTDGVYTVTFNPALDQHFALGPNRLDIPANAVCNLATSGYGPAYWNRACTPETGPVTLTVTVKNASSAQPSVDFMPAMRFNPQTKVSLYFYVPNVTRADASSWIISYCPTVAAGVTQRCIDESINDLDLTTYVDYSASVLFRRIKHFSGYKVDGGYLVTE